MKAIEKIIKVLGIILATLLTIGLDGFLNSAIAHQSSSEIDKKISFEIARGSAVLKTWNTELGLSRSNSYVTITNSKRIFIRAGFNYLWGDNQSVPITEAEGQEMANRLARFYDEGVAILDSRNKIANGALNSSTLERRKQVLIRVRRLAANLEADDNKLVKTHNMLATRTKENTSDGIWEGLGKIATLLTLWDFFVKYILPLIL